MKLPKVKQLFKALAITSVLVVAVPHISSAISMQFSTREGTRNPSYTVSEEAVAEVSKEIERADLRNKDSVMELAETINDFGNATVEENRDLDQFQKASLVRVVDGDTIIVDIYADACGNKDHEYSVRMIGIDTPESVAPEEYLARTGKENSEEGKEASEYTKELLDNLDFVYLQQDVSDTDRYGRLLRYVWIEVPFDDMDIEEVSTQMVNGILLREGVAEPVVYKPDVKHAEQFEQIASESEAEIGG